jgi:hypothetical protein
MDTPSISCSSSAVKKRLQGVTYVCQIAGIFAVIVVCLINLSFWDDKSALWSSLLSGALGSLLPAPKLKKNDSLLSNSAVQHFQEILSGQHDDQVHDSVAEQSGANR